MNVLFLSVDLFSIGGIQRYSRYLLGTLARSPRVARVAIASLAAPGPQGFGDAPRVDLTGGGGALRRIGFVLGVLRIARARRANVIICDHVNLAPIAYAYSLLTHTPYWINVYAIEVWGTLPYVRRRALLGARRVVSDCEFTRKYLEEKYPQLCGRVTVVPDCVDVDRFTPDERPAEGPPALLTVSRLAPGRSKGHTTVMRALAQLRARGVHARYAIAGDGTDRVRLEGVARELGLEDAVRFLGRVDECALPDTYRACDVFVLVSGFSPDDAAGEGAEGEGVPLVVLEAQASGKPVITSRCDGSAESIVDGETGFLVDPADARELATKLEVLLRDDTLRVRMGAAARALAERRFSVAVFDERFGGVLAMFDPNRSREPAAASVPVESQ